MGAEVSVSLPTRGLPVRALVLPNEEVTNALLGVLDAGFSHIELDLRGITFARAVVDRLRARAGVLRVTASPLTERVLVECSADVVRLQDLVADVSAVELPDLPDRDLPAHPLDPAPLVQGTVRMVGAGLGLGLLAVRRAAGAQRPPVGGSVPPA